jgi:hypothetical protein
MLRRTGIFVFLGLAWLDPFGGSLLWGQATRDKADELIRSAQRTEMLGYVLAGVGLLLVVAAIPLGIYWDRKKKARKQAGAGKTRPKPGENEPMAPGASQRE